MMGDVKLNEDLLLYGGTYLNKGGAAIAYGTLSALNDMGIRYNRIVDPEPFFSFSDMKLEPIYRYSDILSTKPMQSISPLYTYKPFIKCLINSHKKEITDMKGMPIWHIGDSPFSDKRSVLSVAGQIIALESLKRRVKSTTIIGGVSIGFPRTKIALYLMKKYFKNYYFFVRGQQTLNNLLKIGVEESNMTKIADFAFQLKKTRTDKSAKISRRINESSKPKIGLCLREYSSGEERIKYIESIRKLVSKLGNEFRVFFIPTSYAYLVSENDNIFCREVLRVENDNIIDIMDLTPGEIIDIFSNFDCIMSARLHGAVFGTLANVPTIHLYDTTKSLEVLGEVFENRVSLMNFSDMASETGPEKIIKTMKEFNKNKDTISSGLKACIEVARKTSLERVRSVLKEKNIG